MKRIILSIILLVTGGLTPIYAHQEHTMRHQGHMMGKGEMVEQEGVGICPVMHEPALREYSYTYEGKTYYFCCPMCIEEFKKDPQKYLSKIKEIKLEAFQYGFSPDPIVVKKDDIVKFEITTRDVTHGVYIKEYGINVSVKQGETKRIEFLADRAGKFDIICSVYCGPGHSKMKGTFIVEE